MSGAYRTALAVLLSAWAADVGAQEAPWLQPGHITISAGLLAGGGYGVGDRAAELRTNTTGTPPPFVLFRAESAFERLVGLDARVELAVTRALAVDLAGTFATPGLGVTVTQDREGDPASSVEEAVSQYTLDAIGAYQLAWPRLGMRARPYVIGGAGYLRQLHEGRFVVETGRTVFGGAGLRYWLRGGSSGGRSLGVRAEARYVRRTGGIEFEGRARAFPAASVLAFAGF